MRRAVRATAWVIVLLCGVAVCAQAVVLWRATRLDGYTFTRYFDEDRAAREAEASEESLADLFAETGLEDNTGPIESIPNRFMLGVLPGGPGRDAISVLTLAGPGAIVSVIAFVGLLASLRRSSPSEDRAGDSARSR